MTLWKETQPCRDIAFVQRVTVEAVVGVVVRHAQQDKSGIFKDDTTTEYTYYQ